MAAFESRGAVDGAGVKEPGSDDMPPPDLRGTRSQAMQRLQVGIGGLAAMVLVVGLASTIMQQARQADDPATPEAAAEAAGKTGDPLVDAGVVPELPSEQVVVPDLPAEQMVSKEPPASGPADAESINQ
jgi:hypothetical protein